MKNSLPRYCSKRSGDELANVRDRLKLATAPDKADRRHLGK